MAVYEEKQKKDWLWLFAWWLLTVSILLLIWLSVSNYLIWDKIDLLDEENKKIDNSIRALKENRSIQAYILDETNKKVIDELTKKSQITKYINHLRDIQNEYGVVFKWFNYSNWSITSQAVAYFSSDSLAPSRVSHFIKNYRTKSWALFDLWFINSFNWADSINFNVNFKLK